MELEKKCPNCGKGLPEEASFCLFCFTDIDNYKKSEVCPVAVAPVKKATEKATVFVALKSKFNKKLFCRISLVAAFLLIMGTSISVMRSINSANNLKTERDTTIIEETSTVAITDNSGETVTNEAGEQIFDVVEVTKITPVSTTEKQGIFDKIFGSSSTENETKKTTDKHSDSIETTKKESFLDKFFGKDENEEKTTQNSSTTKNYNTTTEEHRTTESPATTEELTTTKPTTTNPISAENSTTTQATTQKNETPINDFEYTLSAKYASINKYVGNSKHVTIPAVIEGKYVTEVNQGVFQNNSEIETVSFADNSERPYLWIRARTFDNCENLRVINLPDTDLGIYNHFAYNCLNVEEITLKNNQYRYADGGLYYSGGKGWRLRYYCPASSSTSLKLPDWSSGIEGACNLNEAFKLREIVYHKNAIYFPDQSILPSNLENIFIDSNNELGYDINGIAFYQSSGNTFCAYPQQNKTTELTLPENSVFYGQYVKNAYLKTLRIPKTVSIHIPFYVVNGVCFKNLETVYIQDGHPNQKTLVEDARVKNIYIY